MLIEIVWSFFHKTLATIYLNLPTTLMALQPSATMY